jgi:pilus assembly protein CpaF
MDTNDRLKIEWDPPDGPTERMDIPFGVYTIGSTNKNKLFLPGAGVAPRHAVLTLMPDECYIEDLMSDTGVWVEGDRIESRQRIFPHQAMRIGDYTLRIVPASDLRPTPRAAPADPEPAPAPPPPAPPPPPEPALPVPGPAAPPAPAPKVSDKKISAEQAIKRQLQDELLERLDIKRLTINQVREDELRQRVKATLHSMIAEIADRLPRGINPKRLAKELYDEAVGLGPLEDLLEDAGITEIMVNGPANVYVERAGKIERTGKSFTDETSVLAVIERIVSPIGRRIDESSPYVDARLPDGSRVNAVIPPLSLIGPCLTIRLFSKVPMRDDDLSRFGTLTPSLCSFIRACVAARKNIIISGGTGSGKTTMLNVVSNYLPRTERIITIEDAAELRLSQEHVIRLESRPPNIEGRGAVTIRDLVRNALRMRPDRIVVGECRGSEALDMLQAMNTGHEGSLTTIHANSPRDALSRLETMVLMAGMELPLRAIREQIGAAIHMVVHLSRYSDGTRKVKFITEVAGMEGDKITMQDLFEYRQTGINPDGGVEGHFRPTGNVPTFLQEMRVRGIEFDQTIFDEAYWKNGSHAGDAV